LRELGYEFKEMLHFQERYRKAGGTHIIHVPRKNALDEEYVRSTLAQAGQSKPQIEEFIRAARA
jgi:phage gp36-like protein